MTAQRTGTGKSGGPSRARTTRAPAKSRAQAKPKTVTVDLRGLKVAVAVEAMDDFELVDDLAQMDEGDATRLPVVLRRLVGDAQFRKVMDLVRDSKTGRVTLTAGTELVYELLRLLNPNSSGS